MTEPPAVLDFSSFFRGMPTAYLVMTPDLVIVDANDAYLALVGRQREALIGVPVFTAFPPTPDALDEHGRNPVQTSFERARDTGLADVLPLHQYNVADQDTGIATERYWSLISAPLLGPDGRCEFVLQRVEDITDWMRTVTAERASSPDPAARILAVEAELFGQVQQLRAARDAEQAAIVALRASEARARAVLDTAADGIITTDPAGVVLSVNPAAERMFARSSADMVGRPLSTFVPGVERPRPELPTHPNQGLPLDVAPGPGEAVGVRGDGTTVAIELSLGAVAGERMITAVLRDITERKQLEIQLAHQMLHDPLTGLPNRRLLLDRLDHAVARLRRHPGTLSVLFLDLDGFKAVNDTWGHAAGDQLLAVVAQRLRQVLRAEDLVSRWGGDEFVVLCEEISRPSDAQIVADRITTSLAEPVDIGGHVVRPAVSVGVIVDDGSRTVDDLISAADQAMYRQKRDRRSRV